jgi:hypothetical protein
LKQVGEDDMDRIEKILKEAEENGFVVEVK